ncbi:MAG: MerR family transcriptional regulator [Lachnospiraceae bacterium]
MERYILSISELAKLKHITTETLRHYDRIGLLKPDFVSESGHRYYSIRRYEKLGTILELREMGMGLKEIQEYFDGRNLKKSVEILTRYQEEFERNLREKIKVNNALLHKMEYLRSIQDLPEMEMVFEKEFPVRYMVTFGKKAGNREEHAMDFTKLEDYIHEKIPIIATDRVGIYADERLLQPDDDLIPAIPMMLVQPENAEEEYVKEIPGGKYVCMFYKGGVLEKYDVSFEKITQYIRNQGYRICGNIFQIYKVDVTLTDYPEETVMELQIPVR